MVYTATGRSFSVQMGKVPGEVVMAQWYDPGTGESAAIGACENSGVRAFEPPGAETYGNDWVLVLDAAQAG